MSQTACCIAGLGDPPLPYYTNDSESANAMMIKRAVNFKEKEISDFNRKMSVLLQQQKDDVESAIFNKGPTSWQNLSSISLFLKGTGFESGTNNKTYIWKGSKRQSCRKVKKVKQQEFAFTYIGYICTTGNTVSRSSWCQH